jgi:hypothetical protein
MLPEMGRVAESRDSCVTLTSHWHKTSGNPLLTFPANKVSRNQQANDKAVSPVLDEQTKAFVTEVSERTGVSSDELLRDIVREWYRDQFDVPAQHLRWAMKQSKQDAANWA